MSTKYKFIDKQGVYFTTSTVVGWLDVFTRDVYKDILLDSIRFCQLNKGLCVHACLPDCVIQAWVLMTNPARMTGRTGICIPFVVVTKDMIWD